MNSGGLKATPPQMKAERRGLTAFTCNFNFTQLLCFCIGANSAPEAAAPEVLFRWYGANVLTHVASQLRQRPLCQAINVNSSGRLPSERLIPGDSIYHMYVDKLSS
ncbi:hypothetical protein EVAR_19711_1 [Eumeta japonica]|uniref:Uncharacterized protein n=1 Tax=Eumeta variegata TaxID=151549 RepID=A0A4C1UR30_EUMVA|nr:hypothetical protein EVAR_19711_1 [Eumeta japonica]